MQKLFEAAYFARFKVELPEIKAQLVNLTTSVVGRRKPFPVATLLDETKRAASLAEAVTGRRRVFADGTWHDVAIYARDALPLGSEISGPAIVEQIDATTVIEPGATAQVDAIGNLRIRVGGAA